MQLLQSILTDHHIATALFAFPFLALCAGWLVAEIIAQRRVALALRKVRVVARREGDR